MEQKHEQLIGLIHYEREEVKKLQARVKELEDQIAESWKKVFQYKKELQEHERARKKDH